MTTFMTIIMVINAGGFMRHLQGLEYISVAETKARLSEKLSSAVLKGRRFAITSHGKPKAVILGYKDYLSLIENPSPEAPEEISLGEWKKNKKKRSEVVKSISSLFEETRLSRKGQKGYKKDAVSKMGKSKK